MKTKNEKKYLAEFAAKVSLSITFVFLLAGCTVLQDIVKGPPPPPPPPPASWSLSPGFSTDSISKIAIITEGGSRNWWSGPDPFMTTIEDAFISAAFKKGYRVSDRSDVDRVMQEIRFQQSGLTEADAAKLGRMLNVQAVLIVKITGAGVNVQSTGWVENGVAQYNYSAWCDMSARLIGVETAEVLGISEYYAARPTNNRNNVGPAMDFAAMRIGAALPARSSP